MRIRLPTTSGLLTIILIGCGGGGTANDSPSTQQSTANSTYYKYSSIVQCDLQQKPIVELANLVSTLKNAGADVSSSACGSDGMTSAAICGQPTHLILVVELEEAPSKLLETQGLWSLSSLANATLVPC